MKTAHTLRRALGVTLIGAKYVTFRQKESSLMKQFLKRFGPSRQIGRAVAWATILAFSGAPLSQALAAGVAVIDVEVQVFDLDSAAVLDSTPGMLETPAGGDVRFAYNPDRIIHIVAFPAGEGVELAFVDEVAFDAVSAANVAGLTFSSVPIDLPLEASDTVVLRTDTGAIFKIGNAVENSLAVVTFNYERIQ